MKLRHLGYLAVLITLVGTTFILLGQDTTPSPTPFPNPNSDTVPTGSETVEATQAAQIRHLMDMNNQLLTLLNQNNAMLKASEAERQALSLKIAKLEEQVMANSKHPHGRIDSGIDDPTPAPAPPVAPEVASVPVPVPTAPPAEPTPTPVPRLSD